MQVVELLDAAKKVTGSDSRTGYELRVSPGVMSDWRHGRRTCTLESQIKLAAIAGIDPRVVADAYIEKTLQGTPWLEAGMKAMGKALAGVVVITCIWVWAPDVAHAADAETASTTMYILLIAFLFLIGTVYPQKG